jgi:hypothetical protein
MPCGYPRAFFPDEPVRSDANDGVPGRILISVNGPKQTWTLALCMFASGGKADMVFCSANVSF